MVTLTPATAITLVRKNLDEAGLNESVMYTDENNDNLSLDDLVRKNLPEAINITHLAAPVWLLEGIPYQFSATTRPEGETCQILQGGILEFSPSKASNFLRLVAFKAADSGIVVTDVLNEASPEGRKQLNPVIRGRYDRPRLVRLQGEVSPPRFRYYTLRESSYNNGTNPAGLIDSFSFVREQAYIPQASGYDISRLLRQNIIDQLTAMVLATYKDQTLQQYFQGRANSFAE